MTPPNLPGTEFVMAVRLKAYRLALTLGSLASVPDADPNRSGARLGLGADALDELRTLIEAAALPIEASRVLAAFHAAYEGPELPLGALAADPSAPLWSAATSAPADPLDEFSIYIAENEYPDAPRHPTAAGESAPSADGPEPAPKADPAQELPVPADERPPAPLGIEEPSDERSDNPLKLRAKSGEATAT